MKEISVAELESRFNYQVELFIDGAERFSKEGNYRTVSYLVDEIDKMLDVFFMFHFIDFETYKLASETIRKCGKRIWKEHNN